MDLEEKPRVVLEEVASEEMTRVKADSGETEVDLEENLKVAQLGSRGKNGHAPVDRPTLWIVPHAENAERVDLRVQALVQPGDLAVELMVVEIAGDLEIGTVPAVSRISPIVIHARNVRPKNEKGAERETGRTGRDAERLTHDATGNRTDKRERRAKSARRSGKMARAGRKRRADGARRNGKTARAGRKSRADGARRNGKTARAGRKSRADGARRNGKTARAGRKRRADGARRNGKTGTGGAETSGGWRATKRENWHGRGGNPKRGGGKIDANRPQQQTQPNKLAVTPE